MACRKTLNTIYTILIITLIILILYYFELASELVLKTILMLLITSFAGILILGEKKVLNMNKIGSKSGGDVYFSISGFSNNMVTNEHYHNKDFKKDIDALKRSKLYKDINKKSKDEILIKVIRVNAFLNKIRKCKTVIINGIHYDIDNKDIENMIKNMPKNEQKKIKQIIKDKIDFLKDVIDNNSYTLSDINSIFSLNKINETINNSSSIISYGILDTIKNSAENFVSFVFNTSPFADDNITKILKSAHMTLRRKLQKKLITSDEFNKLNMNIINLFTIVFSDIDIRYYKEKLTSKTLSNENIINTLNDNDLLNNINKDLTDILNINAEISRQLIGNINDIAINNIRENGFNNFSYIGNDDDIEGLILGRNTASEHNKGLVDNFLKKINNSIIPKNSY